MGEEGHAFEEDEVALWEGGVDGLHDVEDAGEVGGGHLAPGWGGEGGGHFGWVLFGLVKCDSDCACLVWLLEYLGQSGMGRGSGGLDGLLCGRKW